MFEKQLTQLKALASKLNLLGFPMPTVRDPKSGFGSISLTLVFISSLLVIVGIVGKWSGRFGGIDMTYAMQFLWTSCSLYFGRKMQTDGKKMSMDDNATQPPKDEPKQ
jgi:hypothetical protein